MGDNKKTLAVAAGVTAVAGTAWLVHRTLRKRIRQGPLKALPQGAYDAVIVGAGPSGSVCAYYLAKGGAKVALLEKEVFPREKVCGDASCAPGLDILKDMGVLQRLLDTGKAKYADNGGLVSPSGLSYIGNSVHKIGQAAACAIKRIDLDDAIAKAAAGAGANLMESFEVAIPDVTFDSEAGLWTVKSTDGKEVKGRVLVCADGSTSRLATKLGLCTAPPMGVSSRAYIQAGTRNAAFDGLCLYPKWSMPGYAAIFKHANGDLGYCYYLIPAGKEASKGQLGEVWEKDLKRLHDDAIKHDPFISRAMGPACKAERMKAGSLRLGGQGIKATYADHVLVVGDAAGHIDPLTGEGIHTAMMGGKFAAETVLEMREAGNFTAVNARRFQERWMKRFGHDFKMSQSFAEAIYRFPIIVDAVANEMQRKGDSMMSAWAEVATCMRPKTYFFRPDVSIPLCFALMREVWAQKVQGRPSKYEMPVLPAAATNGAASTNGSVANGSPSKH